MTTRRNFLSLSAAGGGIGLLAGTGWSVVDAQDAPDQLLQQLIDEQRRLVAQHKTRPRVDVLAALASNHRTMAAYFRERGDAVVQSGLRRVRLQVGRDALIERARSQEMLDHLHHAFAEIGINHLMAVPPYEMFQKALDEAETLGLSAMLMRSAQDLDTVWRKVASLQARQGGAIRLIQSDSASCSYYSEQCTYWSAWAGLLCSAAFFFYPLGYTCAGATLSAGFYCLAMYDYCF